MNIDESDAYKNPENWLYGPQIEVVLKFKGACAATITADQWREIFRVLCLDGVYGDIETIGKEDGLLDHRLGRSRG